MALLLQKLVTGYRYFNDELSDPRANVLPLISSPWCVVSILILYHNFIYKWGPKMMEKRQPFKLENIMIVYNIFQIAVSLFLFEDSIRLTWWSHYSITCEPISYEDTPRERAIVLRIWMYYIVKIIDLLDTVFFVLRKKQNQVTFLHVYHHMSMVLLGYIGTKYVAGGHGIMLGTINSLVHGVMYTYYLLTCLNSEYKKSLWWKKYLTQMQILQFLLLNIHFSHILFRPSCLYPKWISLMFLPQNVFMTFMFTDFYIKSYIKKKKE